jgi:hypothetical protein
MNFGHLPQHFHTLKHHGNFITYPVVSQVRGGPSPMDESLDIFRVETDGTALWRGTAEGIDAAKARVKALASRSPGDYMIYSPATGHKLVIKLKECA